MQNNKVAEMRIKRTRKLGNIYGSLIPMKQQSKSFVNLPDVQVSPKMESIFVLRFNCSLKAKFDRTKRNFEVELFYVTIGEKLRGGSVRITRS